MDKKEELDPHWLARLHALGRMQACYLWFLVIAGVFYWQLRLSPSSALKVPIIDLSLDSSTVLEAGPFVLSFLMLVEIGATKAYSVATEKLAFAPFDDPRGEATDTEPTFLDMAFYTARRSRRVGESPVAFKWVAHLKYPTFLSLGQIIREGHAAVTT